MINVIPILIHSADILLQFLDTGAKICQCDIHARVANQQKVKSLLLLLMLDDGGTFDGCRLHQLFVFQENATINDFPETEYYPRVCSSLLHCV